MTDFLRVSPKRPCRICDSTTYCGYSANERTSICMWISEGETYRGPSRNGGNIHVHKDVPLNTIPVAITRPAPPTIPVAAIEIRDAVYRELIRISPASTYYPYLVSGPDGLLSRGLAKSEIDRYGALPPLPQDRARIAQQLLEFVAAHFPDHARKHRGAGVIGIPGFWTSSDGHPQIWKDRDYNMPLLIIPYHDAQGRIQACQMRLHKADVPEGQKRYRWLSSPYEPNGCSSGTPIHFTFNPETLPAGSTVVITEGALKSDVFVYLRPAARAIATSGVACSHEQLIAAAAPYHAFIAFDADHKTNPHVCRQLARLIATRELHNRQHNPSLTTRIVSWQGFKGIDDAALSPLTKFTTLSVAQWIKSLSGQLQDEILTMWHDIDYAPSENNIGEANDQQETPPPPNRLSPIPSDSGSGYIPTRPNATN